MSVSGEEEGTRRCWLIKVRRHEDVLKKRKNGDVCNVVVEIVGELHAVDGQGCVCTRGVRAQHGLSACDGGCGGGDVENPPHALNTVGGPSNCYDAVACVCK